MVWSRQTPPEAVVVGHTIQNHFLVVRMTRCVKNLFGDQQLSALKDYIQAALKLNYNDRVVG